MRTIIEIGNITSKISTTKEALKVVRHNVAYRAQIMPTIDAQRIIKGYFHSRRRYGTHSDIASLFGHTETAEELEAVGCTPDNLTGTMLETTLRQRGYWDGWQRMVQSDGSFPTGLTPHVTRALELRCDITDWIVSDKRGTAPRGKPLPIPDLFDYQQAAVDAFLEGGRGVIDLPPRAGKTRIAVAITASLGLETLYIVPSVGLAKQTASVFNDHGLSAVQVTGGRPNAKKQRQMQQALVWIATPQTAAKLSNVANRKLLIFDEFHHAAAKTWKAVSEAAPAAWWRLGLTGTHYRADGKDMEMAGVLGRSLYSASVAGMVERGRLVPARIAMLRIHSKVGGSGGHEVYSAGVVDHAERNRALVMATNELVRQGRRVLVLTKEVRHAEDLSAAIPFSEQVDGRDNDAVDTALLRLAAREIKVVVGTSVIGEGRDVPACDALVYAAGGKSKVKVKQDYFRALTASEGKTGAIIVDMADCQHEVLTRHSAERLRLYESEGCFTVDILEVGEFKTWSSK